VTLAAPDPNTSSSFLNIRVANIQEVYDDWSAKGAQFLTPPIDRGAELRCYLRDPDGHLIEVGQANLAFLEEQRSRRSAGAAVDSGANEATPVSEHRHVSMRDRTVGLPAPFLRGQSKC